MARGSRNRYQLVRPSMFWDPGEKKYVLKVGDKKEFVDDLQLNCDTPPRFAGGHSWLIDEADVDRVKVTIAGHFPEEQFGKLDFFAKPDANQRRPAASSNGKGAANAALAMFEVGGYIQARKVYSLLISTYHPDRNHDADAPTKAAEITTAWRELKSHFGW